MEIEVSKTDAYIDRIWRHETSLSFQIHSISVGRRVANDRKGLTVLTLFTFEIDVLLNKKGL